jgi:hypothetical protein
MSPADSTSPMPPGGGAGPPSAVKQATPATVGSVVGSAVGTLVAVKLGLMGSMEGPAVISMVTAIVTAAFHWVGDRLGLTYLG